MKTGLLVLTLMTIASTTGGFLTTCSSVFSQESQNPNSTTPHSGGMHDMNRGSGMNHSMEMDLGAADANYDLRFIDAMSIHHQGAIEMAKEAQQKSQRPEIKKLAQDIITAQNREIKQLKQWRQAWYPKAGNKPMAQNSQMGHMMEMSSEQMQSMMMNTDLGAADPKFDLRFINAMVPHHQGAVTMAGDALNKSKRPEIKKLAQEIINSQQAEIAQMQQWRKAWYKQ